LQKYHEQIVYFHSLKTNKIIMKRFFLLFVLLLTLGGSAYAQVMYKCTGENVRIRKGPGTNYGICVSAGGVRSAYQYGETYYLWKGATLKYDGAQKNGFIRVTLNDPTPQFEGAGGEINTGWVSAKYLKRVTACTACKGTGYKGVCPHCNGDGMGYCCNYTGKAICNSCGGDGVR
jgi:hypothetical protein